MKHIRFFLALCLPPLVIMVVAVNILNWVDPHAARQATAPPSWELPLVDCSNHPCAGSFAVPERPGQQEEEQWQPEIAARILTPGNPLQWVSDSQWANDLQNLDATAIECAVRSPPRERKGVLTTLGGDLPDKGLVSTTMPSAAWRPRVPGPGGEEWINWACSVSKPPKPIWLSAPKQCPCTTINGQVLAARG